MKNDHASSLLRLFSTFLGVSALGMMSYSSQVQAKVSSSFANGSVLIGYDATCNATYAGSLRYNSANAATEYCNGSGWTTVTSGTANSGGSIGGSGGVLLRLTNGSATAPSLTFFNDIKTGLYYTTTNNLNFTTNGVQRVQFNGSGFLNLTATGAEYRIGGITVMRYASGGDDYTTVTSGQNAYSSVAGNTFSYTVAIGTDALRYETGKDSVAIGYYALQGVSGTPETNGQNTVVGDYASQTMQGAIGNAVSVGYKANIVSQTDDYNVSIGYQTALTSFSGGANTVVGANSGAAITSGFGNTVIGANALMLGNPNYSTIFGYGAFYSSSVESTAAGYQAGYYAGQWDTAFGVQALYGTSGSVIAGGDNVAAGDMSLFSGQSAMAKSTAIGYQALYSATTGTNNSAVGYQAGYAGTAITTGSNNTFIGYQAQSNGATYSNGTAIGNGAVLRASNSITFGNASVTTIYGQPSGITNTSDRREKKDIKALPEELGLDFIGKLKPVSYRLRNGSEIQHYGLIAQDLEQALPARFRRLVEKPNSASLFGLLSRDSDKQRYYQLNYMELVSPIIFALQQQEKQLEEARKELDSARQEHDDLVRAISENDKIIKALSGRRAALNRTISDREAVIAKGESK